MPSTAVFGAKTSVLRSSRGSFFVIHTSTACSACASFHEISFTSFGGCNSAISSGDMHAGSTAITMISPCNSFPDTCRIASGLHTRRPFFLANTSTAKSPFTSVAVVTTAAECNASAICCASSLAPPRCPDSTGITNCPASSSTSTGLSTVLWRIKGAMARTAIPRAPMKITGNCCAKASSRKSGSDRFPLSLICIFETAG